MILVGTAGTPTIASSILEGIQTIPSLGLDAMEVEFTHGINMGMDLAKQISRASKIRLSVHAPYYVNLNSRHAKKIVDSENRILASAERAHHMRARDVVFHSGFYSGKSAATAYNVVRQELQGLVDAVAENGWAVRLCPETTGKVSQFGSYQELVSLCQDVESLGLTFDWAHVLARSRGELEFAEALEFIERELGKKFLQDLHMHCSGVEWTKAGERRHLNFDQSAFPFEQMIETIKAFKISGTIICESPNLEQDALKIKRALVKEL